MKEKNCVFFTNSFVSRCTLPLSRVRAMSTPSSSSPEPSVASLGPCSTAFDVLEATKADLSGKTAIVTGGASGIGAVTSEALAKAGAKVIIACRRVEEGKKIAAEINNKGYKVRTMREAGFDLFFF